MTGPGAFMWIQELLFTYGTGACRIYPVPTYTSHDPSETKDASLSVMPRLY